MSRLATVAFAALTLGCAAEENVVAAALAETQLRGAAPVANGESSDSSAGRRERKDGVQPEQKEQHEEDTRPEQDHFQDHLEHYLPPGDMSYASDFVGPNASYRKYMQGRGDYTGYIQKYGGSAADYNKYVALYSSMAGDHPSSGADWQKDQAQQTGSWARAMNQTYKSYIPPAYAHFASASTAARQGALPSGDGAAATSLASEDQKDYQKHMQGGQGGQGGDYQKYMQGGGQGGDYSKYHKEYMQGGQGGDYEKYMQGSGQGGDYSKYYKEYMQGGQGGQGGDYEKYMQGSGQGGDYSKYYKEYMQGGQGGQGGDYEKYMQGGGPGGDYSKYSKEYMKGGKGGQGDYQKYMHGGGPGGNYSKYAEKYMQSGKGGQDDYKKYVQRSGQDSNYSKYYDKYMPGGGHHHAESHVDGLAVPIMLSASPSVEVGAPGSAASCNTTEQLEAWRAQQVANLDKWVPSEYQHWALAPIQAEYRRNLARLRGELPVASDTTPRSAADCDSMDQLEQWRAAREAEINEYTPEEFQQQAMGPIEEEFAKHRARLHGRSPQSGESVESEGSVAHGQQAAAAVPKEEQSPKAAKESVEQGAAASEGHDGAAAEDLSAKAKQCKDASECMNMSQLRAWYRRQEDNIKANVPEHWQKFAQDTVDEDYAKNWARIKTAEIRASVPAKYQSEAMAKVAAEVEQEIRHIEGRGGAEAKLPTTPLPSTADDAIQTEEQLKEWREKQEKNIKDNVPVQWQKFAQATIDEEYAKISARVKAVEAARKASKADAQKKETPKVEKAPEEDDKSENKGATTEKDAAVESEKAEPKAAAAVDDEASPIVLVARMPEGSKKLPVLAAVGLAAAFALAVAGMRVGGRLSRSHMQEEFGAPFLRLDAMA